MKTKGAVKFFAIALAVVCLFQLSFTFIAKYWDNKAEKYAQVKTKEGFVTVDPGKKRHYLDSAGRQTILNIGLRKYNYLDIKERELNLGLDLRGGMHVTLQVAMDELIKKLSNSQENAFTQALARAKERQKGSQEAYIDLFYDEYKKANPNGSLAPLFATLENKDYIKPTSSDQDVLRFMREQAKSALDNTYNIIRTRIDKFGVTQPNIQLEENSGRIIVELPGADDPERVRKYLQGSAKLEFYTTYTFGEAFESLDRADKALYTQMQIEKGIKPGTTVQTTPAPDTTGIAKAGADTSKKATEGGIPMAGETKDTGKAGLAKKDTSKAKKANERPLFQALWAFQPTQEMGSGPIVGYVRISDSAKVNRYLARPEVKAELPAEMKFAWSAKAIGDAHDLLQLFALRTTGIVGDEAMLTGDVISDARKDVNVQDNSYEVSMQMNPEGASAWARITRDNIGKFVAIVLDNQVYSAPRVNSEIPGGRSQITGNFTATEAGDLANILKSGKLPVRVEIIEEAIVGPSLGKESIRSGLLSLLAGVLAIVIFMVVYYNRSGWVANLALLINLFFIIGVLTSLNAALTLPGIAGIVLTLATAVDANVLIYERVRDELQSGKGMKLAISEGFKAALSSIVDANLVALLTGFILLAFGTGPIYGFAVILVIGILTSMFCSILITRLIFDWLLEKDKKVAFGNDATNNFLRNINFDFVGKRETFYIISGITIIIGIASLATRGLNYGVEFEGGYSFVVGFDKTASVTETRDVLTKAFEQHTPEVKTYGDDRTLNITTDYMINQGADAKEKVKARMIDALKGYGNPKVLQEREVSSTIAADIKRSAWSAIGVALLGIFIYIVIRFKRWQFALGATVALAHDILFVLTFFSLLKDIMPFSLDVDQAIIAALLTIAGYSMNDTVVVFDRIREYLANNKRSPLVPTINDAINKTLSRTVITSFTIFIVVLILFLFGGQVIKGFAFAMLVGIIVGTYSSIFVATPIVVDFHGKEEKRDSDLARA